jgi:nucleolar MIF4G domain-containing protein 1
MLSTITELKNNKPRKQDAAIREKTGAFTKCIGRMKYSANNASLAKGTGSCLRITLKDVLDAETRGRWWMVGASWAGNQKFIEEEDSDDGEDNLDVNANNKQKAKSVKDREEEKLLALASSQRMNTDARRSIFCIVMGSSDCNDAFVKLARAELLKPKNERDVIRVLVHCCGEEKSFNPFYAHLIMRVCEYQQKSKFTLMLSFWDIFKQLESLSDRKTANFAKLLAKLLLGTREKYLTLGVLKRIEFSPTDMPEQLVLFLSIVMSTLFEATDSATMREIFDHDVTNNKTNKTKRRKRQKDVFDSDDEDDWSEQPQASKKEDLSELKESIATFLLQYVQSSPNNVKGSKFHENFAAAMNACGPSII